MLKVLQCAINVCLHCDWGWYQYVFSWWLMIIKDANRGCKCFKLIFVYIVTEDDKERKCVLEVLQSGIDMCLHGDWG